jgi:hypothetical protein
LQTINFRINKKLNKVKMSHLVIHFLLLAPLLATAVSKESNRSSAATAADSDTQLRLFSFNNEPIAVLFAIDAKN